MLLYLISFFHEEQIYESTGIHVQDRIPTTLDLDGVDHIHPLWSVYGGTTFIIHNEDIFGTIIVGDLLWGAHTAIIASPIIIPLTMGLMERQSIQRLLPLNASQRNKGYYYSNDYTSPTLFVVDKHMARGEIRCRSSVTSNHFRYNGVRNGLNRLMKRSTFTSKMKMLSSMNVSNKRKIVYHKHDLIRYIQEDPISDHSRQRKNYGGFTRWKLYHFWIRWGLKIRTESESQAGAHW